MLDWLIQNEEVINMSIQTINLLIGGLIALTGIILVGSLWFHRQAVLLQKSSLQANMFSEISGRISNIMGEIPEKDAHESERYNWYIRIFNEFEALIFLAKQKFLSQAMSQYYQHFIIEYIDELAKNYPQVHKEFSELSTTTFSNLREFYRLNTGKKPPF